MKLDIEERLKTPAADTAREQEITTRLELLCEVGKSVGLSSQLTRLIERITRMTQNTLNAMASSVLLFDDDEQELFFEVAAGPVKKTLRRIRMDAQSGIAGWVACNGKPLIVNDVASEQRFDKGTDIITGFVTRSIICAPLLVHGRVIGVIEVLNKLDASDFTERDLETLVSVASTAAISIENARLHKTVIDAYKSTIKALAAAIDAKDPYTHGHSQRVMEYALLGGTTLSLSREELEDIEYAGILHDIGKIAIPDSILNKPNSLLPSEWEMVHKHPVTGANMLAGIPFLKRSSELILHHHERYEGNGYPDGLKGEEIPIGARLIAVADAFDTMTTDRAYRAALTEDYCISELYGCSGTQFCPIAVEAFVTGFRRNASR